MPVLVDFHTHTNHSTDALGTVDELVEAAVRAGVTHLALTEHVDFVPCDPSCGFFKPLQYEADVVKARKKYPGLNLALGIELGMEPEYLDQASAITNMPIYKRLDFVIGSVHAVSDCLLGDDYFTNRNRKQAFTDYLSGVKRAVLEVGPRRLIDVVGHLDVVKRYAPRGFADGWLADVEDLLGEVLKAIVDSGVGLEINVSGFRQAPKEQYPNLHVLRLYRRLGGEVLTIGSDSHTSANLLREAGRLKMGQEVAREAGFTRITVFRGRKPVFLEI